MTRHPNIPTTTRSSHPKQAARTKHHLAASLLSDSDGVDSPTYDGDVESSATVEPNPHVSQKPPHYHHHSSSSISTLGTPVTLTVDLTTTPIKEHSNPISSPRSPKQDSHQTTFKSPPAPSHPSPTHFPDESPVSAPSKAVFNPAALTPQDIQAFVQKAIKGEPWRKYKINPPPVGRPVRIYADGLWGIVLRHINADTPKIGVYDLFHFG